jgi:hypothetical protein
MPDIQSPNPATESPPADVGASHGLAGLKKMSTTAGLGSGDYAAVSPLSVIALVASALGLLVIVSEVLAALSVVGLICGILALRQISHSNGTQTGRPLAWSAVVLGLAVTGWVAGTKVVYEVHTRPHREQILQLITSLDSAAAKSDYHAAYQLFSDSFQQRVKEEDFRKVLAGGPGYGDMVGVSWNNEIVFGDVAGAGPKAAVTGGLFRFRLLPDVVRQPIDFVREDDGTWKIQDLSVMFPPPKKQ